MEKLDFRKIDEEFSSFVQTNNISLLTKTELEEKLIEFLTGYHRIKIIRTEYNDRDYPGITILDSTRNIIGYIYFVASINNFKVNKVLKQIKIILSDLDRPIFYVFFEPNSKRYINYLASDQIHQYLLLSNGKIKPTSKFSDFVNDIDCGTLTDFVKLLRILK